QRELSAESGRSRSLGFAFQQVQSTAIPAQGLAVSTDPLAHDTFFVQQTHTVETVDLQTRGPTIGARRVVVSPGKLRDVAQRLGDGHEFRLRHAEAATVFQGTPIELG